MKDKIIEFVLLESASGNWESISIQAISKQLKLDYKKVKMLFNSKEDVIFSYYNEVNSIANSSIEKSDLIKVTMREIILEVLMCRLDIMQPKKIALANILNASVMKPKYILSNLNYLKDSFKVLMNNFAKEKNFIYKQIMSKGLVVIWCLAFNKWLSEEKDEESSYVILDRGLVKLCKIADSVNN